MNTSATSRDTSKSQFETTIARESPPSMNAPASKLFKMSVPTRLAVAGLASLLCISLAPGCRGNRGQSAEVQGPEGLDSSPASAASSGASQHSPAPLRLATGDIAPGLSIVLSDGRSSTSPGQSPSPLPRPKASPLSAARVANLLSRVPRLVAKKSDTKAFAFRKHSRPAPRAGATVMHEFPAKATSGGPAPVAGQGTLEVTRFAPEGKVVIAPQLSISFSRPMVAITSHEDSVKNLPVIMSPTPPGRWRWVGTKTLLFDPDTRFPMATKYSVEIPKGTKAANGEVLAKATKFTFTTPTLLVKGTNMSGRNKGTQPTMFIRFDQRIDPAAVLEKIRVEVGAAPYSLRLASDAEVRQDKVAAAMAESERKRNHGKRWLAFVTEKPLPKASRVSVTIDKGAPSAEGPRRTSKAQSFHFRTYSPLFVDTYQCGWGGHCAPGSAWTIEFNNPLDEKSFDASEFVIKPKLPGQRITLRRTYMTITGQGSAQTVYKVKLTVKAVKDTFGQTLKKERTLTFKVGDASPSLFGQRGLTVADPLAKSPEFQVHSINVPALSVKVYKVSPEKDWDTFARFMQGNPRRPKPAPGTKVVETRIRPKGKSGRMVDTAIDLRAAMGPEGKGHAVVVVEPVSWHDGYKPRIVSWVQVTDIGLDAFGDDGELIVWTTNLADGKTRSDADVWITKSGKPRKSNAKGVTTLALSSRPTPSKSFRKSLRKKEHRELLVARSGSDVAFIPASTYWWQGSSGFWNRHNSNSAQWMIFDDRGMYKPGETVRVKGWVRLREGGEGGDITRARDIEKLRYTLHGSRGNKLTSGVATLSALGGFDLELALPKTANLGRAHIEFQVVDPAHSWRTSHSFQIQEFRRPEFEISSEVGQGPYIVGKGADVEVSARYYAGGPLAAADVNWTVHTVPASFTPPNRGDYSFGTWTPWWGLRGFENSSSQGSRPWQHYQAKTDASGKHILHMDFLSVKPAQPMSVVAEARVQDVNRQAWSSSSTFLVHPSQLYIGLKRDRYFVQRGEPIKVDGIVASQEGALVAGRAATVRAVRVQWQYKGGEYKQIESDEQVCQVTSSKNPFHCTFKTPQGGRYKIIATVLDSHKRPNRSEITMWVTGGKRPPDRTVKQEQVTLIPNKKEYAAGDTATIMVQSPFFPAEGIMTIRRSGIVRSKSFHMATSTTTLSLPIREDQVPNVHVQVDLVGATERVNDRGEAEPSLPRRPAYAVGTINLAIPPAKRTLSIEVTPKSKSVSPGSTTSIAVRVLGANGAPVAHAEVSAMVVDESVLALSSYKTPDPIAAFYGQREPGGVDYHQRQWLALADPQASSLASLGTRGLRETGGEREYDFDDGNFGSAEKESGALLRSLPKTSKSRARPVAKKAGGGNSRQPAPAISVRKNFAALAAFAPAVLTDAKGRATVRFKVPDNLTRYRIMVVAAAEANHFGKGESSLVARLPLMVRPSPPRFLNFGDRFELPVVLQNQTDKPAMVEVAVRSTNVALTQGAGRAVLVPANDRVEVRFPAQAQEAGRARFVVVAASGSARDANEFSLPVWTPATTETFATYGEIDGSDQTIAQPVRMPPGVIAGFGGLDISLSSTQLQALTDAFLYLVQYPYECSEQTASRIMGVAALRDVLSAFEVDGAPSKHEADAVVARDIRRLASLQNSDGGFAYWLRGRRSVPYISIHAAHALARAQEKGFSVPARMLSRSQAYLRTIERHIPSYYGKRSKRMLRAYALYVRKRMGDGDVAKARRLVAEAGLKGLSLESLGWLMSVLHGDSASSGVLASIRRYVANNVSETAGAANWVDGYTDDAHLVLHSSRRTDAVLLEALIEDSPKSDLIAKVVRGLLAHRKKGRWGNTQENVFVLLALDAYFQTYEKLSPNFVARMWLGDGYAGEQEFKKRSTDRHQTTIPMAFLAGKSDENLVLQKSGSGRLYYRIGMTYAPKSLALEAADHGFAVERRYEAVDEEGDVKKMADGSWKVKAGARVRVKLTMVAESRRYHVALVDALPAGLEPMNPALAVSGSIPESSGASSSRSRYWWWSRTWYEHQNMRDERVEAFTSMLWAGVHKYEYVTRATTPGRFVVPPAKAEEMYSPETFGRSASDVMVVE